MKIYEPLTPPSYPREHAWIPAVSEENDGLRLEITRTQERLVARVHDRATLDQLSSHFMRRDRVEPLTSQTARTSLAKGGPHAVAPLYLALALLIGAVLGMLALSAVRYFRPGPTPMANEVQEIDLPSARAVSRPVQGKPPKPSKIETRSSRQDHRAEEKVIPVFPTADLPESKEQDAPPLRAEAQTSKRMALQKAYDSDEVQTWSEGGETGFVLAGPLQQNGNLSCRNMVQWKRGGEQGDASNVSLCKNDQGKWVG